MKKLIIWLVIFSWIGLGVSGNLYRTVHVYNLNQKEWLVGDIIIGVLTGPLAWIDTTLGICK